MGIFCLLDNYVDPTLGLWIFIIKKNNSRQKRIVRILIIQSTKNISVLFLTNILKDAHARIKNITSFCPCFSFFLLQSSFASFQCFFKMSLATVISPIRLFRDVSFWRDFCTSPFDVRFSDVLPPSTNFSFHW